MADEQPEISNKAIKAYVPESEVIPEADNGENQS